VLNQREIAKLVGIAPLNDDSGKRSGARHIRGGRAEVRAVLYMATLTATRYNPVIKAFYQRLLGRGKAQKVALTAAMRKLLIILNAMVKTQTLWNARVNNCPVPEHARGDSWAERQSDLWSEALQALAQLRCAGAAGIVKSPAGRGPQGLTNRGHSEMVHSAVPECLT
jgi:transposase